MAATLFSFRPKNPKCINYIQEKLEKRALNKSKFHQERRFLPKLEAGTMRVY
jgi:hypothetical protein